MNKKPQMFIIMMLVFMLSCNVIPLFPSNLTVAGQELNDALPVGVETYLIKNFSDYKNYGLDKLENLPTYNSDSLTEFHMPIVYMIPSSTKMDINKFIKQGIFLNSDKNFTDRLLDSGYNIYGDFNTDKYFVVDYWIKVKASDKPFSVDFVPKIELENKDYSLKQYAWWNSSYMKYKILTIDHTYIDTDLVNFTVLVNSTNTTMLEKMNDGNSLRFVNLDNSTEYKYEIEKFDDTSQMVVWVKIPRIECDTDTRFIMYYNNTDAIDNQDAPNTWDSDFVGVWHMNDYTISQVNDSTSNINHGAKNGANNPIQIDGGCIGYSQDFSGSANDDFVTVTDSVSLSFNTHSTISAWVYFDLGFDSGGQGGNNEDCDIINNDAFAVRFDEGEGGYVKEYYTTWQVTTATGISSWVSGTWYYVCFVNERTGDDVFEYVNDVLKETDNDGDDCATYTTDLFFGDNKAHTVRQLNGRMDEIRISDVARNSTWVKASYHSQYMTSGFLTFADEISGGFQCPDIIYSEVVPTHGSTTVSYLISYLNVTINVSNGANFNYSIECSNGNTTSANGVGNGTYNLSVCCLEPETFYYWYVNSSVNATCGWVNYTFNFTTKASGCQCTDELTLILNKLDSIENILEGDEIIELEINQWSMLLALGIFVFLFAVGYNSEKRSGGLFLLIAGFTLFYIEALATLNGWLSPIFVLPFLSPLAIYIVVIGAKKFTYGANLKTDTKQK